MKINMENAAYTKSMKIVSQLWNYAKNNYEYMHYYPN